MLGIPHCLDSELTDGGEVISLTRRLCSTPQNFIFYFCPWFRIYKTIILPVVLYGCETWSLTVSEEHKLRVFENRVLRIFGSKKDGMTEGWRKLHNEELHNLYSSPSIKVEGDEMDRTCGMNGGEEERV
jgi:hypothetical protein